MGLPDYDSVEFKQQTYKEWNEEQKRIDELLKLVHVVKQEKAVSDGSTASYYELPTNCKELQDLISAKNMNAQIGEIFRECYRYGQASHSDELRGIKKILFYANAELKRLQNVDS
jgi:hypothetical protein